MIIKKIILVIIPLFVQLGWTQTLESLVGQWKFDDPENLTTATVGYDLDLVGSHTAVAGPDSSNGAVYIGIGSYYIATHGIAPNGDGNRVNDFTIVMDVKLPNLGIWYVLYQTNPDNTNDGDWAINPDGAVGIGATGYSPSGGTVNANEWYRLAIVVGNGIRYDYYLDGNLILNGSPQPIDGRFSLDSTVLLLADDNSEDGPINVAEIMMFSRVLEDSEISALGGYGHTFNLPVDTTVYTYLQTPTPNSIYVCWHADESTESIVEYGTTISLGSIETGDSHTFYNGLIWHWVQLIDLMPETTYYYRAITDTAKSQIKKFKTPPQHGSSDGHIRFAVLGDTQQNWATSTLVISKMKEKLFELYGDDLESYLNCVIHLGDIVQNGNVLPSYKFEYFNPIAPISGNVPFMVSIGNHEVDSEYYFHYMKYEDIGGSQGEKYYSFRMGPILFIAINSNWQYRNQTQVAWLENLLQDASTDSTVEWIFVFCHHPWRSELWVEGNVLWLQDNIIPILEQYNVDLYMHGHTHAYQRGAVTDGSLRLLQSGGGGGYLDRWGMYGNQNYLEILKSIDHHHYTIFDLDISSKRYTATTYSLGHSELPLDNEIIDQFSRDKSDTSGPDLPTIVSPLPGTQIDTVVALQASPFSGTGELMSSHFQITVNRGEYDSPLFSVIRNHEDFYGDSGPPNWTPVDLNAEVDITKFTVPDILLWTQNTFWWRVRYRNRNLQWSDWSDEGSFITVPLATDEADNADNLLLNNSLYENYPNPFNSSTSIKFQLQNSGYVSLNIYNSAGQLVKRLINEWQTAGEHYANWDGTDESGQPVASGTYIYQLKAGDYRAVNKANLIK